MKICIVQCVPEIARMRQRLNFEFLLFTLRTRVLLRPLPCTPTMASHLANIFGTGALSFCIVWDFILTVAQSRIA